MYEVRETILIVRGCLLKIGCLEKESVLMEHMGAGGGLSSGRVI